MSYNASLDQYEYGHNFSRDGSDYNPSYKMEDDFRDIGADIYNSNFNEFVIVVTGRLYTGRSTISGASGLTDLKSLQVEIRKFGVTQVNNEVLAARLLPMSTIPQHITAIYIQPIR